MTKEMTIKVKLESVLLLGSGEGYSSLVDTDIIFDDYGLPYFPARRLKGLLRESAQEVVEMLASAGIKLPGNGGVSVSDVFGTKNKEARIALYDLHLGEHLQTTEWLKWAYSNYKDLFSVDTVLDTMTEIRYQTAIDANGIAAENSLRTLRGLKAGYVFTGRIFVKEKYFSTCQLLALACTNLRHVGSKRMRGFGEVSCSLWENGKNVSCSVIEGLKGGK